MSESSLRSAFRKAIGDPELPADFSIQARAALRQDVELQPRRQRDRFAVLAAAIVVVAIVAGLVGPRLFTHRTRPAPLTVYPSASPVQASPSPDPNACRLPVVVELETDTIQLTPGFIDVATGQFAADPNVSVADLPHTPEIPSDLLGVIYDPAVKRWVPLDTLSPDQLSYLYTLQSKNGTELHIYDLVHYSDRILWTSNDAITISRWRAEGIYVSTEVPVRGGSTSRYWRIDAASGQAVEIDYTTFDPFHQLLLSTPPAPGSHQSFGISGGDPERALYTIGGRDPGTPYTIFVIIDGKRVDIYSGVNGDAMDFDPYNVWHDGQRLWFGNFDSKYLWSWTAATGLTRHSVQIPGLPDGPRRTVVYRIAGPCIT